MATTQERGSFSATQTESGWTPEEIVEVAYRQKRIIWLILIGFVALVIPFSFIVIGFIQLHFIFKLAQAVRSSAAWAYIILGFIPVVGMIALLHLSSKATKILQANGVKVGLMGAKSSDLELLKAGA